MGGMGKIKSFKEICRICHKVQKQGKKVVFCHGSFDILHCGHVSLLVEAKKLGDVLVVGVDHDCSVRLLKGPSRPINDHKSRMFVLSNLESVDYVFLIRAFKRKCYIYDYYSFLYRELRPDIIASFHKSGGFDVKKKEQSNTEGILYMNVGKLYKYSSSKLIKILGLE